MKVKDSLAAWMLDSAVTWFGITIENALQERVKVGSGANVEYKPRYTLARLLNAGFRIPKPQPEMEEAYGDNPWGPLLAWAGKRNSGIKWYKYVEPDGKDRLVD